MTVTAAKGPLALPRKPVVAAICVVVAALHLVTGPDYRGPFRAFVTGWLIDLALPFALVLLLGVGAESWPMWRGAARRATAVFLVGAGVEVLQYLGVPLFGHTFDPVDVLMYALGVLAAVAFERVVFAPETRTDR